MKEYAGSDAWGPNVVVGGCPQCAWASATDLVLSKGGSVRNLMIRINGLTNCGLDIHDAYVSFCRTHHLLDPKHVAYTIFPFGLAENRSAKELYSVYNRTNGFFDRVKTRWGTYFRRFSHYDGRKGTINQVDRIISAIRHDRSQGKLFTAAYTMIVQQPGPDTTMRSGGPCLNYVAFQGMRGSTERLGLFAVYRNHDFLTRAYGNYRGLGQLLNFVCKETGLNPAPLTCVSSRAYISDKVRALKVLVERHHGD